MPKRRRQSRKSRQSREARRPLPPPRSPRRGTLRLAGVLAGLVALNLYVFLWRDKTSLPEVMQRAAVAGQLSGAGLAPDLEPSDEVSEAEAADAGRWLEGEVQEGDSLGQILRREGLEPAEADRLIRALEPEMDFKNIRPGQTYDLHIDNAGRPTVFEFRLSRTDKVLASRAPLEKYGYRARKIEAPTQIVLEEVGGTIENSLYASIKESGEDPRLVAFFVDVFAFDLNFYIDTHQGDTYRLLVEKEYLNGEFLRYGRIVAAEYSGDAGTYRAFLWKAPGAKKAKYYDENGRSIEKTFLKTPLKYVRVSSKFNPHRMHPILHRRRGHWGVDYAAPSGTPVWAAASGKIVWRGRRGGAGNCIMIRHDNGLMTVYMHLSKYRSGQHVGSRVRQKDVIGYVGMTGLATGPHLHFGVKKHGHYIDPLKMKMTRGAGVPKKHMGLFKSQTQKLIAKLAQVPVGPGAATAAIPPVPPVPAALPE